MNTKCINLKCNKYAVYNNPGSTVKLYCKDHKVRGMIDISIKKCEYEKCRQNASYNIPSEKTKKYCYKHKLEGMVIIKTNLCAECNKLARFGYTNKKTHCGEHKKDGMLNLSVSKCAYSRCTKSPSFNYASEKKATHCAVHKLPTMIDIRNNKCEKCSTIAFYNYAGMKKGRFCSKHKLPDMISIKFIKCAECDNQAYYLLPEDIGKTKIMYCIDHKLPTMVNKYLVGQICNYEGCETKASCNYTTEHKYLYCSKHKLKGMIDITNKRCKYRGCPKRPTFGYADQHKRLYCEAHKLPNMENVNIAVCESDGCKLSASFACRGEKKPRFCARHAPDTAVSIQRYTPTVYDYNNYKINVLKFKDDFVEFSQFDSARLYNYLATSYENNNNKFIIYHNTSYEPPKKVARIDDPIRDDCLLIGGYSIFEEEDDSLPKEPITQKTWDKIKDEQLRKWGLTTDVMSKSVNPDDLENVIKIVIFIDNKEVTYKNKKDIYGKHISEEISEYLLEDIEKYRKNNIVIAANTGYSKRCQSKRITFLATKIYKLTSAINVQLGLISSGNIDWETNKVIKLGY